MKAEKLTLEQKLDELKHQVSAQVLPSNSTQAGSTGSRASNHDGRRGDAHSDDRAHELTRMESTLNKTVAELDKAKAMVSFPAMASNGSELSVLLYNILFYIQQVVLTTFINN